MTTRIISFLIATALLASCSSAYRTSQTPDDVYFSPARAITETNDGEDRYVDNSADDRYLRMKVQNRNRWSSIDDYNYWNSPAYSFNNSYFNYGSPFYNNYSYYGHGNGFSNGWYNAYFSPYYNSGYCYNTPLVIVKNQPIIQNVSRPMLGGYTNRNYSNTNNTSLNSSMRKIFSPNQNNTSNYNNNNRNSFSSDNRSTARSYSPSYSNSNSSSGGGSRSSSSSSGSTSVSRPTRH